MPGFIELEGAGRREMGDAGRGSKPSSFIVVGIAVKREWYGSIYTSTDGISCSKEVDAHLGFGGDHTYICRLERNANGNLTPWQQGARERQERQASE